MKFFALVLSLAALSRLAAGEPWTYLDNGQIRLGVNLQAGACIGWFSASGSKENLLNAYDAGRYLQQSYYGDEDGSDWNGKPWRYNPVQGGSWRNEPAVVLGMVTQDCPIFYAKTRPRHWATGKLLDDVVMEEYISLEHRVARLTFRMTYSGTQTHKARHQELPALFVNPALDTLIYSGDGGMLERKQPGFPNEMVNFTEPWIAWVNAQDQGLGLWCPHTQMATCYRVRNGDKGDCSYLAPVQTFALTPGLVFEYETALTLGTTAEIRQACEQLSAKKKRAAPLAREIGVQTLLKKADSVSATLVVPAGAHVENCNLHLNLHNSGKKPIAIREADGRPDIQLSMKRSDGLLLTYPPSSDGSSRDQERGSRPFITLGENESRSWEIMAQDYVRLKSGTYKFKLSLQWNQRAAKKDELDPPTMDQISFEDVFLDIKP